jgi:hypothetical protein
VLGDALLAAHEGSLAEHEAALRDQLVTEARAARTKQLLDGLTERARIRYDEQAIQQAIADDSLLGNLP